MVPIFIHNILKIILTARSLSYLIMDLFSKLTYFKLRDDYYIYRRMKHVQHPKTEFVLLISIWLVIAEWLIFLSAVTYNIISIPICEKRKRKKVKKHWITKVKGPKTSSTPLLLLYLTINYKKKQLFVTFWLNTKELLPVEVGPFAWLTPFCSFQL